MSHPDNTDSSVKVGSLVRYYLDGWRCGYVQSVSSKTVKVRPITSKYASSPSRLLTFVLADVYLEE